MRPRENDSNEWQLDYCYFLEIDHGLPVIFPAVTAGTGEVVLVLDSSSLYKVLGRLPQRLARITRMAAVVNTRSGFARNVFDIGPRRVFSDKILDLLCRKMNAFRWALGGIPDKALGGEFKRSVPVMIAISADELNEFGCPYCGYYSGYVRVKFGGTALWDCGDDECGKRCCVLFAGATRSSLGFAGFYPELQAHPRRGIPSHR